MKNSTKRAMAFVMSLALLAGTAPTDFGGFIWQDTAIVASAATVNGVNFNENWSSTTSIPVPDHDSYEGINDKPATNHVPTSHSYTVANNITLSATCDLPPQKYERYNNSYKYFEPRYAPLNYHNSVRMYLNNHSINANGKNILMHPKKQYPISVLSDHLVL